MESQNYFETTDIDLATYLKYRSFDIMQIDRKDPINSPKQCTFIFRVDKGDSDLLNWITDWNSNCGETKRMLFLHKFLKKQVKQYFDNLKPQFS